MLVKVPNEDGVLPGFWQESDGPAIVRPTQRTEGSMAEQDAWARLAARPSARLARAPGWRAAALHCLPFVDELRTLCVVPTPQMKSSKRSTPSLRRRSRACPAVRDAVQRGAGGRDRGLPEGDAGRAGGEPGPPTAAGE